MRRQIFASVLALGVAALGFSSGCRAIVGIEPVVDVDGGPNDDGQMAMDATMAADASSVADSGTMADSSTEVDSGTRAEAGANPHDCSMLNDQHSCAQCCATANYGLPSTAMPAYPALVTEAENNGCDCAATPGCPIVDSCKATDYNVFKRCPPNVNDPCGACVADTLLSTGCAATLAGCLVDAGTGMPQPCTPAATCFNGCSNLPR